MLDGWLAVFTGPQLIDELRRSSDDELSAVEGTSQVSDPANCQFPWREALTHITALSVSRFCN